MGVELNYKNDDAATQRVSAAGWTSSDVDKEAVKDEVFYNESGSTILAGHFCTYETGTNTHGIGKSIKSSDAVDQQCVGVAIADIASGEFGLIRRRGIISTTFFSGTGALATDGAAGNTTAATNASINIVGVVVSNADFLIDVRC